MAKYKGKVTCSPVGDVIPTTSSAVALIFRRAGLVTVPDRTREGVYVSGGDPNRRGPVSISIQIDYDQENADEWADMVRGALDGKGLLYEHEQDDDGYHRFTVYGRPAPPPE